MTTMNDAQKLDAILTAVQTPATATVDTAALSIAITTALQPLFDGLKAQLTDIQGQVDEPVADSAPTTAPVPAA